MRSLAVLAVAVLLTACANTPVQTSYSPRLEPSVYEVDSQRVATIERQARKAWARVVWVNPPTRRVKEPEIRDY